jgi:hypothetical protein
VNVVESGAVDALYASLQVKELFFELFLLFSLLISAYLFLPRLVFKQIVAVSFNFKAIVADGIKVAPLRTPISRYFVRLALIIALMTNFFVGLESSFLHFY